MTRMKSIFFFALISIGLTSFSQDINKKLTQIFSKQEIENMKLKNPNSLVYYNLLLTDSYIIKDNSNHTDYPNMFDFINLKKTQFNDRNSINSVEYVLSSDFNIMLFNLKRGAKNVVYFKIGDSNKIIQLLSEHDITEKFNKIRGL